MFKYKTDLRVNNQITLSRLDLLGDDNPRYENLAIASMSQDEINSLIERNALMSGLKTRKRFYDTQTRVIPLTRANELDKTSPPYLDLISKFQQPSARNVSARCGDRQKRGYGETPRIRNFPVSAGQALRESGAAVDVLCEGDSSKCRVITLTLPASGHDAYKCLSDYSAEITNKLLQIVRRKKDDGFYYFYVLEHQKRGALHWHICLFHQDKELSRELGEEIVSKWRGILRDTGTKGGLDLLFSQGFGRQVQSNEMQSLNQTMYSGCASYFAKYAGKTVVHGSKGSERDINCINAEKYPVSSFWGRSRNLVRKCKELSFHYDYIGMEEEIEWKYEEDVEVLSQFNLCNVEWIPFEVKRTLKGVGEIIIARGSHLVAYCQKQDYFHLKAMFEFKYAHSPSSTIIERAKRRGVTVSSYNGTDDF